MKCNLPFERLPVCSCDKGSGPPPTKLQRLECKMRRGPCAPPLPGAPEQVVITENG